jgi:hypothetical protein
MLSAKPYPRSHGYRPVSIQRIPPSRFLASGLADYLAAQYLVDHQLPVPAILQLILHPDGSGTVVPQLRETAAWLAALVSDLCNALLSKQRVLSRDTMSLVFLDS